MTPLRQGSLANGTTLAPCRPASLLIRSRAPKAEIPQAYTDPKAPKTISKCLLKSYRNVTGARTIDHDKAHYTGSSELETTPAMSREVLQIPSQTRTATELPQSFMPVGQVSLTASSGRGGQYDARTSVSAGKVLRILTLALELDSPLFSLINPSFLAKADLKMAAKRDQGHKIYVGSLYNRIRTIMSITYTALISMKKFCWHANC